jgi:transcription elongation GreA/GreB family factor
LCGKKVQRGAHPAVAQCRTDFTTAFALGQRTAHSLAVDKRAIVAAIIEQLASELRVYDNAARAAHAEATHEQSRAENKYDTRSVEASYLARGQSRQAAEIVASIEEFRRMPVRDFSAEEMIDVGALVELRAGRERAFYFVAKRAGGTEVMCEENEVLVITPQSPLGQQLVGKKQGERVKLPAGAEQKIVSVC